MYNTFAHVENGKIKRLNVKRGGLFQSRRLGKLSPDYTYAAMGLYPITGTSPPPGQDERVVGPTYEWDAEAKIVNKVYVIHKLSSEEKKAIKEQVTQVALNKLDQECIDGIREFLVAKFDKDPLMPTSLIEHEKKAKDVKEKLKEDKS